MEELEPRERLDDEVLDVGGLEGDVPVLYHDLNMEALPAAFTSPPMPPHLQVRLHEVHDEGDRARLPHHVQELNIPCQGR